MAFWEKRMTKEPYHIFLTHVTSLEQLTSYAQSDDIERYGLNCATTPPPIYTLKFNVIIYRIKGFRR